MGKRFLFGEINNIENRNFNQNLENFYKLGIRAAVKENIQNSLDAKLYKDQPVKIIIKMGEINVNDLPGYLEVKERIKNLNDANQYTAETVANMKEVINKDKVYYITFEDQNTKGLTYTPGSTDCSYFAYAYQQGNHYESGLSESLRSGSHGIGKIASNAMSEIHMMYFANCDEKNHKHLGGTVCLVEHQFNGQSYRDMGYFTNEINDPYVNDNHLEVFKKDTRGLKIIIPFLREEFYDEKEIITSICSDYFCAIHNNMIEVQVNDHEINSQNLATYIFNDEYFVQQYEEINKDFVVLNYKNYIESEKQIISIVADKTYTFDCYFMYDEHIKRGRVAFVRRLGMKITDRVLTSYARKPFNVVIIPNNDDAEKFLKSLENQAHNEIDVNSIRNTEIQKNAKKILNKLDNEIKALYDKVHNEYHPAEGIIDTGDLLYTFDKSFKDVVNENTSTVFLNTATSSSQLTKINAGRKSSQKKKKDEKGKQEPLKKKKKGSKSGGGNDVQSRRYMIYPEFIHRVSLRGYEYLECDLSSVSDIVAHTRCNLVLKAIDGEGKEVITKNNIETVFSQIVDMNSNSTLNTRANLIRNVSLKNGKIKLKIYFNEKYNSSLKYIYFVEV